MTTRPYTDADVKIAAQAISTYDYENHVSANGEIGRHQWNEARAVLDALAAAGRLNSALDHIAELAIAYVNEPVENTDRISERYYELEAAVRHMQAVDAREAQP